MKFELNFLPDVPTVNGRIYEMKDLEEIFSKPDIPVTSFPSKGIEVNMSEIIGYANLTELSEDKVEFEVRPVKLDMLNAITSGKLTINAFGDVKRIDVKDECGLITETKKVVKDLTLYHLFAAHETKIEE
jgi:hypothetical protein